MSSNDNSNNDSGRPRRGSFTTQTFTNLFGQRNNGNGGTPAFPGPISTAAAADQQRRRLSVTGVGLSGTSPTTQTPFGFHRRSSVSTAGSDSIDESAIEDDEGAGRSNPTTPYSRRLSFGAQALRTVRGNGSPGNGEGNGFNWSEQLRSRAESSVSQAQRPHLPASVAPSHKTAELNHERTKSVSELQPPPTAIPSLAAAPAPAPVRRQRPVPDAIGERILKGDFYMD